MLDTEEIVSQGGVINNLQNYQNSKLSLQKQKVN
jgi:hypothetical protein